MTLNFDSEQCNFTNVMNNQWLAILGYIYLGLKKRKILNGKPKPYGYHKMNTISII